MNKEFTMKRGYYHLLALVIYVLLWLWLPEALNAIWILFKVIVLGFVSLMLSFLVLSYITQRLEDRQ